MNLYQVTASFCAGHAYRDIFGVRRSMLPPCLLNSLCEPEAQTLPHGSQGSWFWCYTPPQQRIPNPQRKSRLSLFFLLEGNAWIHLSQFMQHWWVHTFDLTCWRFVLWSSSPTKIMSQRKCTGIPNNHKPPAQWIVIQCCHILFKCCYISMRDGHAALLVQTSAIPSSQSGDANHWLQAL